MSFYNYLQKTYGSGDKKKKKEKGNSKNEAVKPTENINKTQEYDDLWKSHGSIRDDIKADDLDHSIIEEDDNDSKNQGNIHDKVNKKGAETQNSEIANQNDTVYRDIQGHKVDLKSSPKVLQGSGNEERLQLLNMGEVQLAGINTRASVSGTGEIRLQNEDPIFNGRRTESVKLSPMGRKVYPSMAPDNRFGILPGIRWDGVDRSNGFEKKWFLKKGELTEKRVQDFTTSEDY